ncbi:MAG: carbohydrate kinase family protein [Anaerolineales bacterium]|nr:carbohydrate kinase family protein [Anaerolineales bacterium]
MKRYDVLGLGVSTVDALYLVDHFPSDEENQQASAMTLQGGGPVATAIVTLGRLGASAAMADTVGDDWRGEFVRRSFAEERVAGDLLETCPGSTSTLSCVLVRQHDGARSIVWYPGTAPELMPSDRLQQAVTASQIVHLNGRHFEACLQACDWAHQSGGRVSFDGGAHRFREELRRLVPRTDICIVARQFAQAYTGEAEAASAARRLLAEGPSLVVVTDGARGSWVHAGGEPPFSQPAFTMPEVVDTTGCGDSFHGAFVFGLLQGLPLREIARFAGAVAALNTQELGGRAGLPSRERVEAFLALQPAGG